MDALVGLGALGGFGLLVWLGRRWFQRRFEEVDTYYDRDEDSDSLATDVSSWPGGRGI